MGDLRRFIPKKPLTGRTRSNYLTAITNLIHFAERRGYLAKGLIDLSVIERTREEGEVAIFSPAELKAILAQARPELVPFLAVCAFAGLRHAEASRLDWSEISDTTNSTFRMNASSVTGAITREATTSSVQMEPPPLPA